VSVVWLNDCIVCISSVGVGCCGFSNVFSVCSSSYGLFGCVFLILRLFIR